MLPQCPAEPAGAVKAAVRYTVEVEGKPQRYSKYKAVLVSFLTESFSQTLIIYVRSRQEVREPWDTWQRLLQEIFVGVQLWPIAPDCLHSQVQLILKYPNTYTGNMLCLIIPKACMSCPFTPCPYFPLIPSPLSSSLGSLTSDSVSYSGLTPLSPLNQNGPTLCPYPSGPSREVAE